VVVGRPNTVEGSASSDRLDDDLDGSWGVKANGHAKAGTRFTGKANRGPFNLVVDESVLSRAVTDQKHGISDSMGITAG